MPKFVSIYQNGDSGPVVTVTEAFARSIGATILENEPAVGGRTPKPLEAREAGAYLNPPEPNFAPAIALPETSDQHPDDGGHNDPPPNLTFGQGDPNNLSGDGDVDDDA